MKAKKYWLLFVVLMICWAGVGTVVLGQEENDQTAHIRPLQAEIERNREEIRCLQAETKYTREKIKDLEELVREFTAFTKEMREIIEAQHNFIDQLKKELVKTDQLTKKLVEYLKEKRTTPAKEDPVLLIPADRITWVKCRNPDCEHQYQMNLREYFKYIEKNTEPNSLSPPPLICQKCGEESIYRAVKCAKCGLVFEEGTVRSDFLDRCAKCGYSKIEEERKKAAMRSYRPKDRPGRRVLIATWNVRGYPETTQPRREWFSEKLAE